MELKLNDHHDFIINLICKRASYNGYYPSFPSWRRGFDSLRSLNLMSVSRRIYIIFIISAVWFSGCAIFIPGYKEYSTAKKYFNNGNYDEAVFYVSKSLQKKPANDKALALLELSYPIAVNDHSMIVNTLKAKMSKSKWPELVHQYEALNQLSNEIRKLKPILKLNIAYELDLSIQDYTEQLNEAKPLAADYHYMKALDLSKEPSKKNQKEAAINFKLALRYIPGYMNAQELYEESREAATFTLLIRPFDGNRNITSYIRDQMMMKQSNASKEFLRIINRDQLETILNEQALVQSGITENNYMEIGKLSGADHILSATIVTTFRPVEKIIEEDIKQDKEVVLETEEYVDSTGVTKTKEIKGTVMALVQHHKKSSGAKLSLSYQIIDLNNNRILYNGTLRGQENFFHEWATYEGDKRALNKKFKSLIKRKDKFSPSKDEMLIKIAKSISYQLQRRVAGHYSN